ncbi:MULTISPECIES: 16S rRNA (adenine(1518)-N(6)/adenine(1519)-N(6))-dimethyltransferase RsmA [unclassified Iodidimonas]|jgi:16S rRNA (adenine1518-N6/adenine1519-N6)-dimethyltransferase|uniref:16S rRNA (adenine(1518)-N(6)/adenine(1519)-N(6))- dimethyltransferase RsmA n=1 Tax=unclassified Iodidimonas TaxID=2626145 RepID=UPI002482EE9A|nr:MULTISPECIES: 16S rRNA (adenine(1518)-N(6)/adenine(1519)-N(6))-dimethyltransferase RsmA [unclassified Iodidimonas]
MSHSKTDPPIDPLPPLREVIARHGLQASRSLGQNFILDLNLTRRIARAAGPLEDYEVYEVGPGPGGLTRALLMEGAAHVTAVERDSRTLPALAEIAAIWADKLSILADDALKIDEEKLFYNKPVKIVSNLPYNIGTALFVRWMTGPWAPWWSQLILMFQREVAERIIAKPGSKAYGRLSILSQWRAKARIIFPVPARAFTPAPKVDSAIIEIIPTQPLDPLVEQKTLETITEHAFGQRRKMLRASLRPLTADSISLLKAADIDPTARAEEIDIAGFCRIARQWQLMRDGS